MSQALFLEAVVTWDEKLCQQNLQEALPKLISHLQEASVLQEEIGILKIICVSFLPWVQIEVAENLVFADISSKGCLMLDKVLEEIKLTPKHSSAQANFEVLLEVLVELLDCFTQCIKFAQGAGNSYELATVHSLPYGAIHLLKGTYTHCKESSEVYGDALACVTEPLSVLFKKAHALQVALLGLLDNIVINKGISQQDIDDLCFVCQGLFEICQVVSSLDVKLVVSLWKAISRLSGRHKNHLKDGLDVDTMVTYLCTEINKGYSYLLQLAPPGENNQELSLSQGDSAAFQKSLKVLGYQMRVIISLLDSFIDSISDCVNSVYDMVVSIFRSLPPCIVEVNISVTSLDEIRRHLVNGIEPLVNLLVQNRTFVTSIMSQGSDVASEDSLARLELLVKIADCLPKQTDDVLQCWMKHINNNESSSSIFDQIFLAASHCYVAFSMSLTMRTTKEVPLYEYVCTQVCGLVGSLPAKYFNVLEESLLQSLFSVNMYVSCLTEDVWCFISRFGSADLCYQHTKLLIDVCEVSGYPYCVVKLVKRLVKFLAPDHQNQLMKCFPPDKHVRLWCDIFLSVLPTTISTDKWQLLIEHLLKDVENFISKSNRTYTDLVFLMESLTYLVEVFDHHGSTQNNLQDLLPACVKGKLSQFYELWDRQWTREAIFSNFLSKLTELSGFLITHLGNEDFLMILDLLLDLVKADYDGVKITACHFLKRCRKTKFSPDSNQPLILKKIAMLYGLLLQDKNSLVHHTSLESFTQFAESTPYESLVPECLGDNQQLQNKVVAFLSKVTEIDVNSDKVCYLKQQYNALSHPKLYPGLQTSKDGNQCSTEVVGQVLERKNIADGDMLDDIEEPALKRKRCLDIEVSFSINKR
ncbi:FIGNL1-interacting regulator of recombination and mitosis-like [Ruditapes philippinarum]|uniref:FIGNL1-interacting regulator of recombination and mitosis-like n=1 Tax=Ruditapes philippinarum TaxID=129788 RepID=UPI00295BB39B|nr:FIGNL1-interacting regulator of recombination and mitosis-like [Ruditapes philippinarum]